MIGINYNSWWALSQEIRTKPTDLMADGEFLMAKWAM